MKYINEKTIKELKNQLEKLYPLEKRLKLIELKSQIGARNFDKKEMTEALWQTCKNEIENTDNYTIKIVYKTLEERSEKSTFIWDYLKEKYSVELELINLNIYDKYLETIKPVFQSNNFFFGYDDFDFFKVFNDFNELDQYTKIDNKKSLETIEKLSEVLIALEKLNIKRENIFYVINTKSYTDLNKIYNILFSNGGLQ